MCVGSAHRQGAVAAAAACRLCCLCLLLATQQRLAVSVNYAAPALQSLLQDFYGANVGRSLPRERAAEQQEQAQQQRAPPAAQHAADGQQQQQQQQRQPKQHGSSRGRSSSGVDHVAAAIEALQGVGEESRHRRLHVYRLNQNLQRLSGGWAGARVGGGGRGWWWCVCGGGGVGGWVWGGGGG